MVDAVKKEADYNLKIWAKGKVISVLDDGNMVEVSFVNDYKQSTRILMWYSPDLAQYDTKSTGDEWRRELKTGDVIDAFDSTRIWYAATVLDRTYRID